MNTGIDLVAFATEITRQSAVKADYISKASDLRMVADNGLHGRPNVELQIKEIEQFSISDSTHNQLASNLKIPVSYYNRMLSEAPCLLAENVNRWLEGKEEKRMIRTLDGEARAFLSDRYRRIDNDLIAESVLPVLFEGGANILSSNIATERMHIKACFPRIQGEVKLGDVVQGGISISNSEVGMGQVIVKPFVYRLVCTNGMTSVSSTEFGFNRNHIGKKLDIGDAHLLFRDETIKLDDKVLAMKLADIVRASFDPRIFESLIDRMVSASNSERIADPHASVERLANTLGLREGERQSVLESLIAGHDYSKWGVLNAVTQTANHLKDYARSTSLENAGGLILDLSPSDWHSIAAKPSNSVSVQVH